MELKQLLEEITSLGYCDEQIAEYTGISATTIYRLRAGKTTNPHHDTYAKVLSFYLLVANESLIGAKEWR